MKGSIFTQPESQQKRLKDDALITCLVSGCPQDSAKWSKSGNTGITDDYHINVPTTRKSPKAVQSL